ncbi:FecR family protein [Dinghuibacter silviterrae]|uniref:FecR family protein n=1 Tax=Dinghuibacter silviterrae TaxID=1539049 RepID=A0A4R8DIH0_9BACT|nr:FecR family protein [Dinghuibacter silviterrae]TDW97541.1 FecR family protein [Dinghuibacter silviterrae]
MHVEDLIIHPRFIRWVLEEREEDRVFWEDWQRLHPGHEGTLEEARTLLRSLSVREANLSPAEVRVRIDAILKRVRHVSPWRPILRWTAAAALVGIVALGVYLSYTVKPPGERQAMAPDSLTTITNTGTAMKRVSLSDGSTALLFLKSSIRYTSQPGASMDVYLTGEAEFSVAPHPNRPFRVYAQDLVTCVLGTRFRIDAWRKKDVRVTVLSGKVSVRRADDRDSARTLTGVILTPNQELHYGEEQFRKVLVDTPVAVQPLRPGFRYDNVPVTDVLEDLRATFGLDIEYDKEILKNCRISADLSDESIYRKLDLICQALDAHYEVIDGVVTIQARPCQ